MGQLKNVDADAMQNKLVLKILEKVKEKRLKFSVGSVTVS